MRKTLLAILAIAFLATVPVFAQTMMGGNEMGSGMMTERQQQESNVPNQKYLRHMQARGMYNAGMMGEGYGTPPCAVNEGYGMMGSYGMMPMMGGGYGMLGNYGMMPMMGGFGMMHNLGYDNYKKYETFAKETRDLRKKLHDLMFEYGEARWNPDTKIGDLNKMAEDINKLRQDIQDKLPQ